MTSTSLPVDDASRFQLVRSQLHTPVLGDVLDALGRYRCFLSPGLRAVVPGTMVVGRAMPVLVVEAFGEQSRPFGKLTDALDALRPGDVYLARAGNVPCASWGEILTNAARTRGAVGAVIDGYHRDTGRLLELDFPIYSRGGYGQDARVRSVVADFGVPVEIDGVRVDPGDLLVADHDGVLRVPADVEDEVLEQALAKVATEDLVRDHIVNGMSSTDAFARFGVL
jgi:regulator of RNase E activity RraA